ITNIFPGNYCGSSQSHEEGRRSSLAPQGIPQHSKSTKSKLEKAPSDKADVHASYPEHEGCKQFSLPFICTEGGLGTTPSHEENLRHSTSSHGTFSHTTSTTTRTRLRDATYTQEVIKISPMVTIPMGVSYFPHHPKSMMSDTLFLPKRALDMLFLSKRERNLPLVPERGSPQHSHSAHGGFRPYKPAQ
uniref:Uncharacterized protein n=1 Tax=Peromyscus maniculatus bairdii TaxID=230844 RepID=A0A8C8W4W6_PERMB